MTITVAAIYENGVLRPRQPLELAEGTEVNLTIRTPTSERRTTELETVLYAEINRLAALGPNWDGYGARPLNAGILDAARQFVAHVASTMTVQPLVVPMSSGALQFEWHSGQRILEIEIEDPATIHYLKWDPTADIQEEDVCSIKDTSQVTVLIDWFTRGESNG